MKKRDAQAQFASAWMYDDRQILCYIWSDDSEQYYVSHLTTDPDLRLQFAMDFKTAAAAWLYFHAVRTNAQETRKKIENIFDGLFEKAGKDYENEDHPEDPPFED